MKFQLHRVPLDKGGYDRMGCYWGADMPLWYAISDCARHDHYLRAHDREGAKHAIRLIYAGARFFR